MKPPQTSTSSDAQAKEEPLDDNRPEDHELGGEDAENDAHSSPASQVGRDETGGGAGSVLDPEENVREGWPIPDQSDVPSEWPEPTVD